MPNIELCKIEQTVGNLLISKELKKTTTKTKLLQKEARSTSRKCFSMESLFYSYKYPRSQLQYWLFSIPSTVRENNRSDGYSVTIKSSKKKTY